MQGPPCVHHRYNSHAGAVSSSSYTLQVTLHNPTSSVMLSFSDQNTTQHTVLLISFPLLKFLGDQWRSGRIAQPATFKKTSSVIPVRSHLVCDQDRIGEGREVILNFTFPDSSRSRKCYSQLHRKWHLPMMTRGAWTFRTRAHVIATYQMTQQYDQMIFRSQIPNSLIFPQSDMQCYCFSHASPTFSEQRLRKSKNTTLEMMI